MTQDSFLQWVTQLREDFDRAFQVPFEGAPDPLSRLISVRIGRRNVAFRIEEVQGVVRCPELTQVPSRSRELLGLSGIRGMVVAVYDLGGLIGEPGRQGSDGWLLLPSRDRTIGLYCDELNGLRTLALAGEVQERRDFVVEDQVHTVMSLEHLLHGLRRNGEGKK